jgi:hypothetical protein
MTPSSLTDKSGKRTTTGGDSSPESGHDGKPSALGLVYRDGRSYVYRSVWRGGRVTSEYRGSGEDALLIDALEKIEQAERGSERWRERSEQNLAPPRAGPRRRSRRPNFGARWEFLTLAAPVVATGAEAEAVRLRGAP